MNAPELIKTLAAILAAVEDAVAAAGPTGAPAGVLYAALASNAGASLTQFQQIMRALVIAGRVRQDGNLYFANR